ncbi:hypothetical protein [Mycolicibacterium llatzerense]|uniref:hypothetical protein n=1 Tax=Mycolicibacterium llatzerense TaxID=280871 RepID=UPI0008DD970E|nr:hypothetical protein [Mycolicibacterium llatzerense]MCT7373357.1 hypothetical protein [Mycolicibacterium llatzerense]
MDASCGAAAALRSTRELKAIHRDCTRKLVDWGLDKLTAVDDIREVAGRISGRDIQLLPYRLSGSGVHGMLVRTGPTDYVVFDSETTTMHREHIILHELSHVLCGHSAAGHTGLGEVLRRENYLDDQEIEAETLASIMGQRVRRGAPQSISISNANLGRILASLRLEGNSATP